MKKVILSILLVVLVLASATAQVSSAFLKGEIYQNNAINPAYFPEGKVFIGLPVLSGTSLDFNSPLSYADIFTRQSDGANEVDLRRILGSLATNNYIGLQFKVNDLYVGFRGEQAAFSFFVNERVEADFYFPRSLVDLIINGNGGSIGSTIDLSRLGLRASYFREIGAGYTYFDPEGRYSVGARLKFLNGFFDASIPSNLVANLTTGSTDLALNIQLQNAILRTSTVPDGGSFIFSPNLGFGVDLGINYHLNDQLTVGFSVTDIGLINWKDGISSNQVEDTNFSYSGIDLEDIDDIAQAVEDSLQDQFNLVEDIEEPYTSWLPLRGNLTGSWKFAGKSELVASLSPRVINGFVQMQYGLGITQKIGRTLRLNVSANRLPQQDFNVGAALALNLGPIQLYGGTDRTLNYDLTTVRNFNYNFGINLVLGRQKAIKERKAKIRESVPGSTGRKQNYPATFRFLGGKKVRVKGRDKIYLIIPKQKRKPPVNQ